MIIPLHIFFTKDLILQVDGPLHPGSRICLGKITEDERLIGEIEKVQDENIHSGENDRLVLSHLYFFIGVLVTVSLIPFYKILTDITAIVKIPFLYGFEDYLGYGDNLTVSHCPLNRLSNVC